MEYLLPNDQNGNFTSNSFRRLFIVNKMKIKLIMVTKVEYLLPNDQNGNSTSKFFFGNFTQFFFSRHNYNEKIEIQPINGDPNRIFTSK